MPGPEPDRLSQLSTDWRDVFAANAPPSAARRASQHALAVRYCGAVYQYLLSATGDIHAADDLAQEFALRFARGDFRGADPAKGRFRDYVKTTLYHLVADHFRARKRLPASLPDGDALPAPGPPDESAGALFRRHWRQELLDRTWQELRENGGDGMFDALRWKATTPDGRAADGARVLAAVLRREVTPVGFRQTLHRARDLFAALLRREVAYSLATADPAAVEQELGELGLLDYCRPVPDRPAAPDG